ncbi:MAG: hypothetical protein JWP00_1384 [Chloroflexi bacterium]|jgi:hypothetical protein|nr:hypothetical protein [Chloroflexota bacterium]
MVSAWLKPAVVWSRQPARGQGNRCSWVSTILNTSNLARTFGQFAIGLMFIIITIDKYYSSYYNNLYLYGILLLAPRVKKLGH